MFVLCFFQLTEYRQSYSQINCPIAVWIIFFTREQIGWDYMLVSMAFHLQKNKINLSHFIEHKFPNPKYYFFFKHQMCDLRHRAIYYKNGKNQPIYIPSSSFHACVFLPFFFFFFLRRRNFNINYKSWLIDCRLNKLQTSIGMKRWDENKKFSVTNMKTLWLCSFTLFTQFNRFLHLIISWLRFLLPYMSLQAVLLLSTNFMRNFSFNENELSVLMMFFHLLLLWWLMHRKSLIFSEQKWDARTHK